jgi:hypothetical protein
MLRIALVVIGHWQKQTELWVEPIHLGRRIPEEQDCENSGPVNRKLRSTTDAESTVVRHQHGKPTPSYKNHRALDDKAGVITAVKTTTGAVDEASELFELIERYERFIAAKH